MTCEYITHKGQPCKDAAAYTHHRKALCKRHMGVEMRRCAVCGPLLSEAKHLTAACAMAWRE